MSWAFDGMYRLTNEVCVSTVSGASYTNAFQYDLAGNRWSKVLIASTGTTTITNQYNANDQLLKEVTKVGSTLTATNTYAYDANGSLFELYTPTKAPVLPMNLNAETASRLRTLLKGSQSSPTSD